ncbi:CCA tRNA nucleotidyltransferase [Actibacterium pelagium]|uniref:Poly(A) polymerase n=1 Tax=Actibacterium pelagium TaxID=2029103 RepID=A0A917EKY5_9RHOB|nr:CCA tRNA nucleotidyltransferase [Actibacterium pelagium]GGE55595.1 poly(A) polymerase [Actibacterium pelagium]
MTKVTEDWLTDPVTQKVCAILTDAGHQALFVGGCVRNALLGVPVSDLDISTDARPERVMELAKAAGLKAVPTGIDHGTITVVANHEPYEITTFRRDVETDGRRAVIAYADTIEEDAHRRDFTMNALYARPDGQVIDPVGGLSDLADRRFRFIGTAENRIREDYLRILRFFRFHAWYGDASVGIDPDGLAACAANLEGIETLSKERIGTEMLKLLGAPDPAPSVASMQQAGILAQVLPGADATALAVLVHLEGLFKIAPDPVRRLALIGGENQTDRLRLSRENQRRLQALRDGIGGTEANMELGYRLKDQATDVVLLRAALMGTPPAEGWQDAVAKGAKATFPVKSADLMPDVTGAALGAKLKELETRWLESGMTLTKSDLLG